jgi:hypothetical protein
MMTKESLVVTTGINEKILHNSLSNQIFATTELENKCITIRNGLLHHDLSNSKNCKI